MTSLFRGVDLVVSLAAALIWGLAGAAIGTHFVSHPAAGMLGLAIGFSGVAVVLSGHMRERQLATLLRGMCPRCHEAVRHEHSHRRWDPSTQSWAAPSTAWECDACGFSHGESWDCGECPRP